MCYFCSFWPEIVRQRVKHTYLYFAGSAAIAVGSAAAVIRSPRMMALITRNTWPVRTSLDYTTNLYYNILNTTNYTSSYNVIQNTV